VDQDLLGGSRLDRLGGLVLGSFDELAVDEGRPGADERDQVGGVDHAPAALGGLDQLVKAIASAAALDPWPLVTFVRSLTVASVDSIGLVVRRCTQCSAGQS
jgi:hypothetical protein